MSLSSDGVAIIGLESLENTFKEIAEDFPDAMAEAQDKVVRQFKKEVLAKTPNRSASTNRKALKRGYRIKAMGYGADREVAFFSVAPHFHLVERGHNVVPRKAKNQGRNKSTTGGGKRSVEGKEMVKKTVDEFEGTYFKEVESALAEVLKKGN